MNFLWQSTSRLFCRFNEKLDACPNWLLFLLIGGGYFVLRILTLEWPDQGGDAIWKWRFLRYFYETGVWFPVRGDHHMARWAQNIPVLFSMYCFGVNSLVGYYVVPLLTGGGTIWAMWSLVRKFSSRAAALGAVLTTMCSMIFYLESIQFLPDLPATMWTLWSLNFLIAYLRHTEKWYLPLVAGLCMGLGWGCRVTVAYWAFGIGIFLLCAPIKGKNLIQFGKFRLGWDVILFCFPFIGILIAETICFNHFFHVPYGRLSMFGAHTGRAWIADCGLTEYLFSFFLVPFRIAQKHYYYIPRICFFTLTIPLFCRVLFCFQEKLEKKFLAFLFLFALLLHCYMVTRFFPFRYAEPPLLRYFFSVWQVGIVGLFICGKDLIFFIAEKRKLFCVIPVLLFAVMIIDSLIGIGDQIFSGGDHLFAVVANHRIMQLQQQKNLPLLIPCAKECMPDAPCFHTMMVFYGPVKNLPDLEKRMEELRAVYFHDGKYYCHIAGAPIRQKEPTQCVVAQKNTVVVENFIFP